MLVSVYLLEHIFALCCLLWICNIVMDEVYGTMLGYVHGVHWEQSKITAINLQQRILLLIFLQKSTFWMLLQHLTASCNSSVQYLRLTAWFTESDGKVQNILPLFFRTEASLLCSQYLIMSQLDPVHTLILHTVLI